MSITSKIYVACLLCVFLYELLKYRLNGVSARIKGAVRVQSCVEIYKYEFLLPLVHLIERYVILNPIKRAEWERNISLLRLRVSPETFIARAIAESLALGLGISVLSIVSPFFIFVAIGVFGWVLKRKLGEPRKAVEARTARIERELAQFTSLISQRLRTSHDVFAILDEYRGVCGEDMYAELTTALADMKSSNPESGLARLNARIGSVGFGQITSYLLAELRGEDMTVAFMILRETFAAHERELLKRAAEERPRKLTPFLIAIFIVVVGIYIGVLGAYALQSLTQMF